MFDRLFKKKVHAARESQSIDWSKIPGSERKFRTEAALRRRGVPINPGLPVFVDERTEPRSADQARERMLALVVVAARAECLERENAEEILGEFGVCRALTPNEKAFIETEDAPQHQRAQFCFQYECVWALQWALKLVPDMGDHTQLCDAGTVARTARAASSNPVSSLRSKDELWDMADMLYRLHWACVNARLHNKPPPVGLDAGVVWERRRAVQWLVEPGVDWDDVSLDT